MIISMLKLMMEVIGYVSSGNEIYQMALEKDFDILLMDVEMETTTAGIKATEKILEVKG